MRLRAVTWNLWDMPFISTARAERMEGVKEKLRTEDIDIIAFQESWLESTRAELADVGKSCGLPYSHGFLAGADLPFGIQGPGLFMMSRFPIVDVSFVGYSVNGHPYRVDHMDYQAGKGVGLARLQTPMVGVLLIIFHFSGVVFPYLSCGLAGVGRCVHDAPDRTGTYSLVRSCLYSHNVCATVPRQ